MRCLRPPASDRERASEQPVARRVVCFRAGTGADPPGPLYSTLCGKCDYLRCSCSAGALVRHWPCSTQDAARPREASRAANSRGMCRDPACELPAAVDVCRQLSRTGALRAPDALRRAPPAQPAPAPAPARAEARPERAHGAAAVPPASAAHQVRHDGGPVCPAGCMHGVAFISFSLVVRQPGKQPAGACSGLAVLAHAAGAAERFLVQGAQHHSWLTPMAGG